MRELLIPRIELEGADPTVIQSMRQQSARKVGKAYKPFVLSVDGHRPFSAHEVYVALNELINAVTVATARQLPIEPAEDWEYWEKADLSFATIRVRIKAICAVIRKRIEELSGGRLTQKVAQLHGRVAIK